MTTFPDEYIHYWGGIYIALPAILHRGILFDTFLLHPQEIINQVCSEACSEDDVLPLLPIQQAVMHELAEAEHDALIPATAQHRDGAFIERMKHHCWTPRKSWRKQA